MLDTQSMKDLKELNEKCGMDMCGEMGEYHTMTLYGPIFKRTIQISEFTKEKVDNSFIMEPTRLSLTPE